MVFLITGLDHGGAETQLARLAVGLGARGWDVAVVSLLGPGAYSEPLEAHGIPVHHLGARRGGLDVRVVARLHRLLGRLHPRVLVSFMYHANILGRLTGSMVGIPVIIGSIRTPNFGGALREAMERWTESLGTLTTTNSSLVAEMLIRKRIADPRRLKVIRNGIRVPDPGGADVSAIRRDLDVPPDSFLWLAVGRLEEAKDYPTLLGALASLRSLQAPSHRLVIAGEGPQREALMALAAELGLSATVKFLGFRSDVDRLLQAADGFVAASAWEGMSNAVLEALAHGKVTIATRVGGIDELIPDSRHGVVVPVGHQDALAAAMSTVMRTPTAERADMGRIARAHIVSEFSEERMIDDWESLIGGLVADTDARD